MKEDRAGDSLTVERLAVNWETPVQLGTPVSNPPSYGRVAEWLCVALARSNNVGSIPTPASLNKVA